MSSDPGEYHLDFFASQSLIVLWTHPLHIISCQLVKLFFHFASLAFIETQPGRVLSFHWTRSFFPELLSFRSIIYLLQLTPLKIFYIGFAAASLTFSVVFYVQRLLCFWHNFFCVFRFLSLPFPMKLMFFILSSAHWRSDLFGIMFTARNLLRSSELLVIRFPAIFTTGWDIFYRRFHIIIQSQRSIVCIHYLRSLAAFRMQFINAVIFILFRAALVCFLFQQNEDCFFLKRFSDPFYLLTLSKPLEFSIAYNSKA